MNRRDLLRWTCGAAAATAVTSFPALTSVARAQKATSTPMFALRNPGCACCVGWADHLRQHGFEIHLHDSPDLAAVKKRLGIPSDLEGCHTAIVEGYIVEGHVPAPQILQILSETPDIAGISVPGMPIGSPGMEGPDAQPYDVVAFGGPSDRERYVMATVQPS